MNIGLLSDIHANLVALEAVLAAMGPVDALWVTGDSVGYGPDPSDVLALLVERRATMVAGNHDRAVATGQGLELFNPIAAAAALVHREWLKPEECDLLAALPETLETSEFTLCHGSLRDPLWEYVFTPQAAAASFALAKTAHCCAGHTHVPGLYRRTATGVEPLRVRAEMPYSLLDRAFLNPGSVGQPRDTDPRASYAVLDLDGGTVTFHRASYQVGETQRRIRERGLPASLADRLAFGM